MTDNPSPRENIAKILEAFYKYTITPLVFLDRKFNFIRVNEAYAKACQRQVSDFRGKNHFELYPSDELREKFENVVKTKAPYQISARPFVFPDHPDWGVTYWDLSVVPILDNNGEVGFLVFALNDVTERKKTERRIQVSNAILKLFTRASSAKEYLDSVVELINDLSACRCVGIRILNESGEIPYQSYTGFSREFWESENWLSVNRDQCACIRVVTGKLEPQDKAVLTKLGSFACKNISKFMSGLSRPDKAKYRDACLENGFVSVAIIPIRFVEKIYGVIHLADEKEGKVGQDIVEFIESLTPLIGEGVYKFNLADQVQQAQKELISAKRLSDIGMLAATVAHELRNPLAAIRMAAYNIKSKGKNPLLNKHLINIEKKVEESEQIINNLLFYSRIKKPNCEPINIHAILEECIEAAKRRFPEQRVSFNKKVEPLKNIYLEADSLQMKELFSNILNNAYDALLNKKGKIEVVAALNDSKSLKVYIKDNGVGIEAEDLKRAYEPFFTTKAKGTGLGLTVCFQIVSFHNGKINIDSQKGKGTTVSVILPVANNKQ